MNRRITVKQFSFFLIFLFVITVMFLNFYRFKNQSSEDKQDKEIMEAVSRVLSVVHYQPRMIDVDFSRKMYSNYFEQLNQRSLIKTFFTASDMALFDKQIDIIAKQFKDRELGFFHATIDTLYKRLDEQEKISKEILSKPLDYKKKEFLVIRSDFQKNKKITEPWRLLLEKQYKYNILDKIAELKKEDLEKKKRDANYKLRNFENLEIESRKEVETYIDRFFSVIRKRKKKDWFSIYVNAFTSVYDPHTNYFSPKQHKIFNISISGKLEGIGAVLEEKKVYPTVSRIMIGGPSWKQGELEVGDQIMSVAQGLKGKAVSLAGMSLDDAVELIRGKKGSIAVLWVRKKNGSTKKISIIRDEIAIEETYAKSAIFEDKEGNRFGIIDLPEFYFDQADKNGRNAADDVQKEIKTLKDKNIKGLILDLRDNGGGSLFSAVKIASLFIGESPVVQVRRNNGQKDVLNEPFAKVEWGGPLTLLVNGFSASASEILAGAMQDYKRAVIIGGTQTFGKGTVQTLIPFDRYFGKSYLGSLKITTQKFYRVNGESTQLKGVLSDVVIYPKRSLDKKTKEAEDANAMPWDKINATDYKPLVFGMNLDYIKAKSAERLEKSSYMNLYNNRIKWMDKTYGSSYSVPLYVPEFFKKLKHREEQGKTFKDLEKYTNHLNFLAPPDRSLAEVTDTVSRAKREKWYEDLKKDFAIEEAVCVLKDLQKTQVVPKGNKQ